MTDYCYRCEVCEAPLHEGECMNCAYADAIVALRDLALCANNFADAFNCGSPKVVSDTLRHLTDSLARAYAVLSTDD